ncbi:MAG: 30S ribosomal protein S15 [Pseudomonadota bacterium]
MSLSTESKKEIMGEYHTNEKDTGSVEVQVALLTKDINKLTEAHFNTHVKDHHSRMGLMRKVNQRRKLLGYLKNTDANRYGTLIERLSLRDSN